ncbi:hypothetical protein [Enterococcus casseliflavus]|uniref:hypothetical protein n=1 Tax=Enterococcus casseliflavus TaxID=37734 RepID=UPI003D152326
MGELKLDRAAMGKLGKALSFICGADHPATKALSLAAETGDAKDIKQARVQFMRLKPADRKAALTMLSD